MIIDPYTGTVIPNRLRSKASKQTTSISKNEKITQNQIEHNDE